MLQIPEHLVDLIHISFGVMMLYAHLIAVRFADGAGLVGPRVPYMGVEVMNVVALFLPDPEDLVHGRFPVGAPDRQDGELL